jgi:hypothetical protein
MPDSVSLRCVAACAATLLAAAFAVLSFAPRADAALTELRVEGPDGTLDPGTWYVTGSEKVKRGKGDACKPVKRKRTFGGATALGILDSAAKVNGRLAPIRVRQTSFGPQVCQVGAHRSFGHYPNSSGGLLYYVDDPNDALGYVSGFSSADLATVEDGDRVLWTYSVFPPDPGPPTGDEVNTGEVLDLSQVPAHDADGSFTAKVQKLDFGGNPADVDNATVVDAETGTSVATPMGSNGLYTVNVTEGFTTLQARRGLDVASDPIRVCVDVAASACPTAHGRTIAGSGAGDSLGGTAGWDEISSGGGDDEIDLTTGGRDSVHCNGGTDTVTLDAGDGDDSLFSDCEEVVRIP